MKKVLIVSPRFPPSSGPDYHRIRMLLPFLERLGWHATVLAVDPGFVGGALDDELLASIPPNTRVIHCAAIPEHVSRMAGIGALALRSGLSILRTGSALLRKEKFDLVFFSTTEFPLLSCGPKWKARFDVPFIVDLQDPWVNSYYEKSGRRPPGGWFKHKIHQRFARSQEKTVLTMADHIICVSGAYPSALLDAYPELIPNRISVIPFAGSRRDFSIAEQGRTAGKSIVEKASGRANWVYAGAVIPGMMKGIASVFGALNLAIENQELNRSEIRLHFIGTDYAVGKRGHPRVAPLAAEYGLADVVTEIPERISYFETLRALSDADALMMFGSDESGYNPSKLFTYVLAEKPLLAIGHSRGSLTQIVGDARAGVGVTFSDRETQSDLTDKVYRSWIANRAFDRKPGTDWNSVEPFTDVRMAEDVVRLFDMSADG